MNSETFFLRMQPKLLETGNQVTLLFILAIPFSTAVSSVAPALLALIWLASAQFKKVVEAYKKQPPLFLSFLLFSLFIIGIVYSSASLNESLKILGKYRELLLLTIITPFLSEERHKKKAVLAFIIVSVLNLAVSYAMFANLIPYSDPDASFKSRITHSLFVSFFAFYCMHAAYRNKHQSGIWIFLFFIAVYNLFFIVPGRTGQFIFVLLIALFSLQRFNVRGVAISLLAGILLFILFVSFSDKAERIIQGFYNIQTYFQSDVDDTSTSMAKRFTFWKYSLLLIAEKPWLGFGTGSYAQEYARVAPQTNFMPGNPHNEFIMITVQLGIFGLFIFLAFLYALYRQSQKLESENKWIAQGVLLTLIINSTFNSTFLDHTEGHFFAYLIPLFIFPISGKKYLKN